MPTAGGGLHSPEMFLLLLILRRDVLFTPAVHWQAKSAAAGVLNSEKFQTDTSLPATKPTDRKQARVL
jgi:hypothetical protein